MIRRLLTLNGLAVLGVILYHVTGWGFTAMFWWTHRYRDVSVPNFDQFGSLTYYSMRVIEQLMIFSIPAFVFVSGFFIAFATRSDQKTINWTIVLTRIKNLIIPYLIWSILILSARWFQGEQNSVLEYVIILVTGRAEAPYYYVPLLVQLLLISPLLVPLARRQAKGLLIISAIIQIGILLLRYTRILQLSIPILAPFDILNRSGLFLSYIFWFCFGIVAGFHQESLKVVLGRVKRMLPIFTIVTFLIGIIEWEILLHLSGQDWIGPQETLVDQLYSVAVILSYFAFEGWSPPFAAQLTDLGTKSFGVYLVHAPILEYSGRLIYHIVPGLLAVQIVFLPVLIVLGLAVPLFMMAIVNRSPARKFYRSLFG